MTSYVSSIASSVCRWSGISDVKTAASCFMNHQWKAGAVHALIGTAKAALIFGTLYAANQAFSGPAPATASLTQAQAQVQVKGACEDLFAKGFEGRVACNQCEWESVSVPGLDPSKYSLVLDESSGSHCTAVLTEAGQKLISLSKNCHEVWKILGDKVTMWWDWSAKTWY